jgi:hypothetical protein
MDWSTIRSQWRLFHSGVCRLADFPSLLFTDIHCLLPADSECSLFACEYFLLSDQIFRSSYTSLLKEYEILPFLLEQ